MTEEKTRPIQVKSAENLASETRAGTACSRGGPLTIPANTTRRVIVDLGNYYCAFPEIVTSGGKGSKVRIRWAEALYDEPETGDKGNRDEIEGKYFVGIGDTFEPDGGQNREFDDALVGGRALPGDARLTTGDEPLTIESFTHPRDALPLQLRDASFESADPRLAEVIPIALRGAADVLARDVHGLPLLRAAHVRRRHAAGGAGDLRDHARRPAAAQGDPACSTSRGTNSGLHAVALPEPRHADHPAVLALVGRRWCTTTRCGATTRPSCATACRACGRCSTPSGAG